MVNVGTCYKRKWWEMLWDMASAMAYDRLDKRLLINKKVLREIISLKFYHPEILIFILFFSYKATFSPKSDTFWTEK